MNPNNGIAVAEPKQNEIAPVVLNANLYFFSWLSFGTTVYLVGSLLQETCGVVNLAVAKKTARWFSLSAASVVVMGTAVRTLKASECGNTDVDEDLYPAQLCRRTKFAIALGAIGFVFAAAMCYITQKGVLGLMPETILTTLQLVVWCFGVGYITFGESPGNTIGNLYFSTWISFILAVALFGQCFREYVAGRTGGSDGGGASANNNGNPPESADIEAQEMYEDTI